MDLDRTHLYRLPDGYQRYFDGESWAFNRIGAETKRFVREQQFYWNWAPEPEDPMLLRPLHCARFREAMRQFFDSKGILELTQEVHAELEDILLLEGPRTQRQLLGALQGDT